MKNKTRQILHQSSHANFLLFLVCGEHLERCYQGKKAHFKNCITTQLTLPGFDQSCMLHNYLNQIFWISRNSTKISIYWYSIYFVLIWHHLNFSGWSEATYPEDSQCGQEDIWAGWWQKEFGSGNQQLSPRFGIGQWRKRHRWGIWHR